MTTSALTRSEVIRRLQKAETGIRRLGVRRLALFGSIVRGEARADSDVDLLVQFDADAKSFDAFLQLCEFVESLLERRVELVTTEALSPYVGPHILAEAEDVLRAA